MASRFWTALRSLLDKQRPGGDVTPVPLPEGAQKAMLELAQSNGHHGSRCCKDGSPSLRAFDLYSQWPVSAASESGGEAGVTTALLQRNGVAVFSQYQIAQAEQRNSGNFEKRTGPMAANTGLLGQISDLTAMGTIEQCRNDVRGMEYGPPFRSAETGRH